MLAQPTGAVKYPSEAMSLSLTNIAISKSSVAVPVGFVMVIEVSAAAVAVFDARNVTAI